jgi:hypothetical protein
MIRFEDRSLEAKSINHTHLAAYRFLSILSFFLSAFFLATYCLAIIKPEYSPIYLLIEGRTEVAAINTLLTIVFLAAITLMCFFTVFNSKGSDYWQLVPWYTDCLSF